MYLRLIIVVIIIVIVMYVYGYFSYPSQFIINQVSAEDFQFGLLYEKHPIVIDDPVVDLSEVLQAWFKYNLIRHMNTESEAWQRNRSKYLVIQGKRDSELMMSRPMARLKDGFPITDMLCIKLKRNQMAILPYRWNILFKPEDHAYVEIDDYITRLLAILYVT